MTPEVIILTVLASLIFLWIVFVAAPAYCMYSMIFGKGKCRPHESTDHTGDYYEDYQDEIRSKVAELKTFISGETYIVAHDGVRLCADLSEHGNKKTAILIHGYHSSPTNNFYAYGDLLAANGYDLIMPHQRAHGKSEGDHSTFGLLERYDLIRWIEWAAQRRPENDIAVIGVSMGATTIGLALDKMTDRRIKAVILDCGFTSPREQMIYHCRRHHIPLSVIPLISLLVKLNIKEDVRESTLERISSSSLPMLFIHGTADGSVPCEFTKKSHEVASSPKKELMLIDGAEHTLALTVGGHEAEHRIVDFLNNNFN